VGEKSEVVGLWTLIRLWWQARQRDIDLDILWPICLREAGDLDHAKAAFAYHCFNDPAWIALGEERLIAFIDKLEA
jgi:hypothetical protein